MDVTVYSCAVLAKRSLSCTCMSCFLLCKLELFIRNIITFIILSYSRDTMASLRAISLLVGLLGSVVALPSLSSFKVYNMSTTLTSNSTSTVVCNATFSSVSASSWIEDSNPGWNLGNTLDATPSEGDWNNSPADPSTFDDVKEAGFNSVRLPGK